MHARAIRRNIALFYANSFMVSFLLWGGIWLKYLIVDRGQLAGAGAHAYSAGNATSGSEEAARFTQ